MHPDGKGPIYCVLRSLLRRAERALRPIYIDILACQKQLLEDIANGIANENGQFTIFTNCYSSMVDSNQSESNVTNSFDISGQPRRQSKQPWVSWPKSMARYWNKSSPKIPKSSYSNFYFKSNVLQNSPKSHQIFGLLLQGILSPMTLTKSPNLVTLLLRDFNRRLPSKRKCTLATRLPILS